MTSLPPLVVSLGDPCGIGPEIVAAAWQAVRGDPDLAFCVIGDAGVMASQGVPVGVIAHPSEGPGGFGAALPVIDQPLTAHPVAGHPNPAHAPHIIDWIKAGVGYCRYGSARGLVTAPIAKSVLYASGFSFPGHTEYLAELCRDGDAPAPMPVMMLAAKDLRVVLATIHTPLSEVAARLSGEDLKALVRITHAALIRDFGLETPRLVMAGLNPHAGEDGTIGREEIDVLAPLVASLQAEGIIIRGPYPADTLFHDEARAEYDAAVCMYHDQGLIPLKTLDFWGGVNITLGLPIVRTSPDHGTGFGIAGKGIARADSFINALRMADSISRNRALT
ncbi:MULTISPECIES: 4-hydroxythreonine-4-phosphate dehydrogenase PdxA [Asticcacaulis]|uniref:4-hydroxythreonine-4-phosphate dehydrogenase PdxA n=1 Tax=Asticcacaulis TaxID=76890 RepID=UPI001AE10ABD|nr:MULTISPECIES: 4-hydroxythreonine-4-phosphate dehydrogenase PdxA [Asticcacaulis]MBP2158123.1 4-hydroxythreonine-4-phosphate dehydrogenase [Asticcacaulis solisilvae]MDR6799168.1 4-hydroxythreonine-4-phosphate dehydrogenase [Asticcacaulis sp. BE141]